MIITLHFIYDLLKTQQNHSTRSSSYMTVSRPPTPHLLKLQTVYYNIQHPTFGINFLNLPVSLIHISVFHISTNLHTSDLHFHHHHSHHRSLLLFSTLKHTSSSSHFHHRLLHRYFIGLISLTPGRTHFLLPSV